MNLPIRAITFITNIQKLTEEFISHWDWPKIDGLNDFKGVLVHSAAYPKGLDLHGKRVAVVGIGSSGVQITAKISSQVEKLYTWISTPTWMTPGFAPKYSGPGGRNLTCEEYLPCYKKEESLFDIDDRHRGAKESVSRRSDILFEILQNGGDAAPARVSRLPSKHAGIQGS